MVPESGPAETSAARVRKDGQQPFLGTLDELHLLVHPIAARSGDRLFTEGEPMVPMTLLRSKALPTGVLALAYAPVRAEA